MCVAGILKEDMSPLAAEIMTQLLASCESQDGIQEVRGVEDSFAHVGKSGEGDSDDDDDDDLRGLTVRTAWLDEKSSAISAVAALAEGAPASGTVSDMCLRAAICSYILMLLHT